MCTYLVDIDIGVDAAHRATFALRTTLDEIDD
jgi:hypothetical protein